MTSITVSATTEETIVRVPTHVAENLLALLARVSDVTDSEGLDRLFNMMVSAGIEPAGSVEVEENPMYEDYPDDEPTHNIVVED